MNRLILASFVLLPLAVSAQSKHRVSNVADLIRAIGPDREITLDAGEYNLSAADLPSNSYITWQEAYDGYEPIISGVNNMKIIAGGNAKILIRPRYSWVMAFENCSDITLTGVTFGHTEGGYCEGGVLRFAQSQSIHIEKCNLYGSGTVGINLTNVNDFTFNESSVYECTYALLYLNTSSNLSFTQSRFYQTGNFDLVEIMGCTQVTFKGCTFSENYNTQYMPNFFTVDSNWMSEITGDSPSASSGISITGCTFTNNKVHQFANDVSKLKLSKNKFSGNLFPEPK